MSTPLEQTPVRTFEDARRVIDDTLGRGEGLTTQLAWDRLDAPSRVGWLLCETIGYLRDGRFHLWMQSYAEADFDGPRHLAAVAWAARDVDPSSADLLRWTAARGAAVRQGERGEALMSVVNSVWATRVDRGIDWMKQVIERWPVALDPGALAEAPLFVRSLASVGKPALVFDELLDAARASGQDGIVDCVAWSLYEHGATDDGLNEYYESIGGSPAGLLERLDCWIDVQGGPVAGTSSEAAPERLAALNAELLPILDPLPALLGVDAIPEDGLIECDAVDLNALAESLRRLALTKLLKPRPELTMTNQIRATLRLAPDVILVRASELDEEARAILTNAGQCGIIVVLGVTAE